MAAFDKVKCGIPQMDEAIDYIRLGDNVVFRVSSLEEFKLFLDPYVKQAIEDKKFKECQALTMAITLCLAQQAWVIPIAHINL